MPIPGRSEAMKGLQMSVPQIVAIDKFNPVERQTPELKEVLEELFTACMNGQLEKERESVDDRTEHK